MNKDLLKIWLWKWKELLDKNINILVFNYKIDWKYIKNSNIVTKYMDELDNKISRWQKIAWKYNIVLIFKNIYSDDDFISEITDAKIKKINYYLYWDFYKEIDWKIKVVNNFKSVNNNDFVRNNIEWDEDLSRINIYDKIEFFININDIDISKLAENLFPLIELNFSKNENNFIKNLWLKSWELNTEMYSWYLSLWKAIDWIKKFKDYKSENKNNKDRKKKLLNTIISNFELALDETNNNDKYILIINREIIKFFAYFEEKEYKKIVKKAFKQNIELLEWTEDYTEELINFYNYRFIDFIEINNPLSIINMESELESIRDRWLKKLNYFYYYYYKSKIEYSKYLLWDITYVHLILKTNKYYNKILFWLEDEKSLWNKFYIYKKIINLFDFDLLNFESIKLLVNSLNIKKYLLNTNYNEKGFNLFDIEISENDYLIFLTNFINFLDTWEKIDDNIKNYYKFKFEEVDRKLKYEKDISNKDKKNLLIDRDTYYWRISSDYTSILMDNYEWEKFSYVYFWNLRYKYTTEQYLFIIDNLINSNDNNNLPELFNILLHLINNKEDKRYYKVIELIDNRIKNTLFYWFDDRFILYWISILYFEYNRQHSNKIYKINILFTIILLSKHISQIWTDKFIESIYNEFIKLNKSDYRKKLCKEIYESIIFNKKINLINSKNNYCLFLWREKFTLSKPWFFTKIRSIIKKKKKTK